MTISDSSTHAIPRFAHAVDAALDRVGDVSVTFMRPEEKVDAITTIAKIKAKLRALELRVLATADDACEDGAYRTVADLAAAVTGEDRKTCARDLRLAVALERFTLVAEAMGAGVISEVKARVITRALADLDADRDVSGELVDRAEQHLVAEAVEFRPAELETLAGKILEVIAPWIEDERERKRLEAAELRARRKLSLQLITSPGGLEGVTEIKGRIPTTIAGRLRTYLEAFTAPRHLTSAAITTGVSATGAEIPTGTDGTGPGPDSTWATTALGEHVPYHQRLGAAFCSLLEGMDPDQLPIHGGAATTVMVTITLDALKDDLTRNGLGDQLGEQTGGMDGPTSITAAQVRRLACTANIIPVVLGGESEILDLGRTARLFSPAQRRAMALRDKRCRAEGCSVPAAWCEAHHYREPWSRGGTTDLADGKLLCPWHHHRAHDQRYLVNELPNGDIRYTRRR